MSKDAIITSRTDDSEKKINAKALQHYVDAKGYKLIPLKGKVPIHRDWTKRSFNAAKVIKLCRTKGYNVGIVLSETQLVADIDPRNGGDDGWTNLCFEFGIDELIFPAVTTGGGGKHYYMTIPAGTKVVNTLKNFGGVEFKSVGRQVVAAGSVHPDTFLHYAWDEAGVPLKNAPPCPAGLLTAITRPAQIATSSGGGEYSADQLKAILELLDPQDFNENDTWEPLMMCCHHVTAGDGLDVFMAWCKSNSDFPDDDDEIARRWNSCDAKKVSVRGIGTFRKIFSDKGLLHLLPPAQGGAAEDFDAAGDLDSSAPDDERSIKLNHVTAHNIDKVFKLVNIGGKVRIVFLRGKSSLDRTVYVPEIWLEEDFKRALRNKYVIIQSNGDAPEKRMPLAAWWLAKKDRYTYNGLIFNSTRSENEEDEINLWRGFPVASEPGDWSLMRDHIRDVIADGNTACNSYIVKWLAWAAQNPTRQSEVAIVFLSEERGTGKGFLCRAMCRLFGAHGLHIAQRSHLVGKFNAHFLQCGLLFCDEVIWPGHKEDEGVLKALITEPTLTVEQKGVNAFSALNTLKIMLASNEKWVVPASGNERRYAVFEVSAKRKQDHSYFKRINDQLNDGGLAAMLHDLLKMDLEGWHPRQNIPETEALAGQKVLTADAQVRLMGDILESGDLPGQRTGRPNRVGASEFYEHMRQKAKPLQYWSDVEFAKFMVKMGATRGRSNGTVWDFPPLQESRALFLDANPWWPAFDATVTEWQSDFEDVDGLDG